MELTMKTKFDYKGIRSEFPFLSRKVNQKPIIYLDSAASSQKPQNIHLNKSISYNSVFLDPSNLGLVSIVIADAGHITSHNLQPIHLSSPLSYLRKACNPLNLLD